MCNDLRTSGPSKFPTAFETLKRASLDATATAAVADADFAADSASRQKNAQEQRSYPPIRRSHLRRIVSVFGRSSRRLRTSCTHRTLSTIDAVAAGPGAVEKEQFITGRYVDIFTIHKFTPDRTRRRVLDRGEFVEIRKNVEILRRVRVRGKLAQVSTARRGERCAVGESVASTHCVSSECSSRHSQVGSRRVGGFPGRRR